MKVSYSQIWSFLSCRWKWGKQYTGDKIRPIYPKRAPTLGSLVHAGIYELSQKRDPNLKIDEMYDKFIPKVMFDEVDPEIVDTLTQTKDDAKSILAKIKRDGILNEWTVVRRNKMPLNELRVLINNAIEFVLPFDVEPTYADFEFVVDMVAKNKNTGQLWLIDWKIRSSFQDEESAETSIQMPIYQFLLNTFFRLDIVGSIVYQIKAKPTSEPALLKKGDAVSRAKIATDWYTYKQTILAYGFDPDEYEEEMRPKLEEVVWYKKLSIPRQMKECESIWHEVVVPAVEAMQRRSDVGIRSLGMLLCRSCDLKDICMETARGNDAQDLIDITMTTTHQRQEARKNDKEPERVPDLIIEAKTEE